MAARTPRNNASVVLIHGAIVNGWEMIFLRRRLEAAGYRVRVFYYRSMALGLEENARLLRSFLAETPGETLHVVGHSMGGVLLRHVFAGDPNPRPGRLIAIGSPLVDCWIGRRVEALHARGHWFTGRTVREYISAPIDPQWRGRRELGVLAGVFPLGVGSFFPGMPRPNDGVILWRETRLGGITDHATSQLNHFGMLLSARCAGQILRFLEKGTFNRG